MEFFKGEKSTGTQMGEAADLKGLISKSIWYFNGRCLSTADLYKGAIGGQRVEVVIEDGLANHVQRKLREARLHVYRLPRCSCHLHTAPAAHSIQ